MTAREVWTHFGDLTQRGALVEDASGTIFASVGYKQFERALYAHSLLGDGGIGAGMICQHLRKLKEDLGLEGVHFSFDSMNHCWDALIKNGRVRVTGYQAILE